MTLWYDMIFIVVLWWFMNWKYTFIMNPMLGTHSKRVGTWACLSRYITISFNYTQCLGTEDIKCWSCITDFFFFLLVWYATSVTQQCRDSGVIWTVRHNVSFDCWQASSMPALFYYKATVLQHTRNVAWHCPAGHIRTRRHLDGSIRCPVCNFQHENLDGPFSFSHVRRVIHDFQKQSDSRAVSHHVSVLP